MHRTLLAIAHGSRDPRHAATVHALLNRVRKLAPAVPVEVGFLDHCAPRVPQLLSRLEAGLVAVPLLLAPAFHAKTDIPTVLRGRPQAAVLGPDPLLVAALDRRMREAGVWPGDPSYGVVLASTGSSDPAAAAALAETAEHWSHCGWHSVVPASLGANGIEKAVRTLRANGAARVAVATYALAPGLLPDRIAAQALAAGADVVTDPIADTDEVARLVLRRYEEAQPLRLAVSA